MTQSHACCTVPPVIADNYDAKGEYITIAGLKTYTTGPRDAKKAILVIYDIFGYFPQTLQGADILAHGDHENPHQVFMPDFLEGDVAQISWYREKNTDENKKKLSDFFAGPAALPKTLDRIPKILDEIQTQHPSIQSWGIVGYCWGGKLANLSSCKDSRFKAAAACHPAMVDFNDAAQISIPFAMLPSKDEPKEDVEKWQQAIKVTNLVHWWPNQSHGFMAARADLKDPAVVEDYKKAYGLLLNFFHEHL